MTADGQQKHTFRPLPKDAKIISEKNGVRTIEFEDGIVCSEPSKEKREEEKNKPGYTPEQMRNAESLEIIAPSRSNSAPQVDLRSPQPGGPGVRVPCRLPRRENSKASSAHSLSALEVLCFCILLESLKKS